MFHKSKYKQALVAVVAYLVLTVNVNSAQSADAGATIRSEIFSKLSHRAEQLGGKVPVIVQFEHNGVFRAGRSTDKRKLRTLQDAVLKKLGKSATHVKRFEAFPFLAYTVDTAGLGVMQSDGGIVAIQEDLQSKRSLAESVPLIGTPTAWDAGLTGAGQLVAILDTGVDSNHPLLAGKVVLGACFSEHNPSIGISTLCPNGLPSQKGVAAAAPCGHQDCGHGTHVAGIAAGSTGVAKDAEIIAIQVFHEGLNDTICGDDPIPCLRASNSDTILGLDLIYAFKTAFDFPVAAANLSLSSGQHSDSCDSLNPIYTDAIEFLKSVDVATVVATGNEGERSKIGSPSCISSAISVGATCDVDGGLFDACATGIDGVAEFSNISDMVDLVAPGADITSAIPGGGLATGGGTSQAAPHVAGAWAIMKQRNPLASVDDVLAELRGNAFIVNDTRDGGVATNLHSLDLHFLPAMENLIDTEIMLSIEEPTGESFTGIGNVRGWAIGPEGIGRVEFSVDGELIGEIPYGSSRTDVGDANPQFPNSDKSGFGQIYNFNKLSVGMHNFTVTAFSPTGRRNSLSRDMQSIKFHENFFSNPNDIDVSGSSVSQDGSGIVINNLSVKGVEYDVRLEWVKQSQDFNIIGIQ